MKIAISGRWEDAENYINFLRLMPAESVVSLDTADFTDCDALLLPGGGDITPAFFGAKNSGSKNIDTELDILQIQAFHQFFDENKPILGICKGMQLINTALGGNLIQHLNSFPVHSSGSGDLYHPTQILENSCLYQLYGKYALVNSSHHQAVNRLGKGLSPIQWCTIDGCVEAIVHETMPILGLQWHPERLSPAETPIAGEKLLELLENWIRVKRFSPRHERSSMLM